MEPNKSIPSTEQVLAAVRQMSLGDLEKVVGEAISVRASKLVKRLPETEIGLLEKINAQWPAEQDLRFRQLREKFASSKITPEEYSEMLTLTEEQEEFHAGRIEALSDLANTRGVTLPEIMNQLGIRFPEHE